MKREIKFDIVLKHKKDNDIIHEVFTYTEIFNGDAKLKVSYLNEDGYIIIANRMFTGLQDKNGTDIYEGDICKINKDQNVFIITFEDGSFCFRKIGSIEFEYAVDFREAKSQASKKGISLVIEVIGNIHENTELIKNEAR